MPMPGAMGREQISPEFLRLLLGRQMEQQRFDRNNQPGQTYGIDTGDDRAWAAAHPQGYGSVDAPGAFGNNREQFMQEHPGYSGGFYSPQSGRYDAPGDAFTPASHGGMSHDPMAGMPTGGSTDGIYGAGGYETPYSNGEGMANLPSGGDSGGQQQQEQGGGGYTMQDFLDALATMSTQENYA